MTWHLDPETFQHAVLDMIGEQPPQLRRELLEAIVQHPGEAVAARHLRRDVAEVSVRGLDDTWHVVGVLDIRKLETAGPPAWN